MCATRYWQEGSMMANYILDLRKVVGHRPLLQVGASVIVENEMGEILLQCRTDNKCWGYCGGSVELDERVEDAAARELYEESGLIAESLELFGIFSGPETHYVYPNGDEVSNVDVVFICREYSGEMKPQESEVDSLRFFAYTDIPENISPPIKPAVRKWVEMKSEQADIK